MTVYVKITTVYDRGDCNIYLEYVRWAYNIIAVFIIHDFVKLIFVFYKMKIY